MQLEVDEWVSGFMAWVRGWPGAESGWVLARVWVRWWGGRA